MKDYGIHFPENFLPNNSPVYVRNEISINAPKEKIWSWLIRVTTWPEWYNNASQIRVIDQKETILLKGSSFKWRTFKTNITSTVKEYEAYERLSWQAKGFGLNAFHGWLIIPQDHHCLVITEETQYGWLPSLAAGFISKGLYKQHQLWLEGLKKQSESF